MAENVIFVLLSLATFSTKIFDDSKINVLFGYFPNYPVIYGSSATLAQAISRVQKQKTERR